MWRAPIFFGGSVSRFALGGAVAASADAAAEPSAAGAVSPDAGSLDGGEAPPGGALLG